MITITFLFKDGTKEITHFNSSPSKSPEIIRYKKKYFYSPTITDKGLAYYETNLSIVRNNELVLIEDIPNVERKKITREGNQLEELLRRVNGKNK